MLEKKTKILSHKCSNLYRMIMKRWVIDPFENNLHLGKDKVTECSIKKKFVSFLDESKISVGWSFDITIW